jgi:hypothetical protein
MNKLSSEDCILYDSFVWNSRTGKMNLWWLKVDQWLWRWAEGMTQLTAKSLWTWYIICTSVQGHGLANAFVRNHGIVLLRFVYITLCKLYLKLYTIRSKLYLGQKWTFWCHGITCKNHRLEEDIWFENFYLGKRFIGSNWVLSTTFSSCLFKFPLCILIYMTQYLSHKVSEDCFLFLHSLSSDWMILIKLSPIPERGFS